MLVVLLASLFPVRVPAVEVAPRITDREIVERLTRLEEGQKSLAQRIDETNRRIDDLSQALSQRIDDLNRTLSQRIEDSNRTLGQRIEELREYLLWGFGVMFAG